MTVDLHWQDLQLLLKFASGGSLSRATTPMLN